MKLLKLAERVAYTAVRLPFAVVWDAVRLPAISMDAPSSVAKVLREHKEQKAVDDIEEMFKGLL